MMATTIEQSQRLLADGLPAETADMHYSMRKMRRQGDIWVPELYDLRVGKPDACNDIPAWSLGRLWDIFSKQTTFNSENTSERQLCYLCDKLCFLSKTKTTNNEKFD